MKKYVLVVVVVLVLSAVLLVNARPGFPDRGLERGQHGRDGFINLNFIPVRLVLQAKDKIGLNVDQEKKLSAMIETHDQWLIKFNADLELKALKLQTTLAAEPLNLKAAEGLIREQANMKAEMQIARLRFQLDVKALLTPEQLVKVNDLKKEFRGRDGEDRNSERRRGRRK